jgi:hypothetical protein
MTTTSPRDAWIDTFLRASAETADARLVADQFLAAGWRPPLPDSETQWGYRFGSGAVDCVGTEKRARSEALRAIEMTGSRVALVRREVGPWIEVTS